MRNPCRRAKKTGMESPPLRRDRLPSSSADVATATAHYEAAMTMASELEMHRLLAHCHLGLGRLYPRTGKREQPQEHLATARTMYGEMGMTYWLEKLENGGPFLS